MVRKLSPEELQILRDEFDQYDTDKGGSISVEEFKKAMGGSGKGAKDEEVAKMIEEVDLDGDGTIDFSEFVAMMTGIITPPSPEPKKAVVSEKEAEPEKKEEPKKEAAPEKEKDADEKKEGDSKKEEDSMKEAVPEKETDSEADYETAWKEFDSSLKGSITASQLRQLIAGLGEKITDTEVDEIINSVDGEDKISYKEFKEFVKRKQSKDIDDIVDGY